MKSPERLHPNLPEGLSHCFEERDIRFERCLGVDPVSSELRHVVSAHSIRNSHLFGTVCISTVNGARE